MYKQWKLRDTAVWKQQCDQSTHYFNNDSLIHGDHIYVKILPHFCHVVGCNHHLPNMKLKDSELAPACALNPLWRVHSIHLIFPYFFSQRKYRENVLSSSYTVNPLYNVYCILQRLDAVCVQIVCLNLQTLPQLQCIELKFNFNIAKLVCWPSRGWNCC